MTGLVISAAGLCSSLGLSSAEACAAARAGLVRTSQVDTLNSANEPGMAKETLDGIPPVVAHQVPVIGRGHTGLGKLAALGRPALEELLRQADLSAAEHETRTGLCLCLSDDHFVARFGEPAEPLGERLPPRVQHIRQEIAARLAQRLAALAGWRFAQQWTGAEGRMSLLGALAQASRWLKSGEIDRCVIGALDSLVEPAVLQACAAGQVLKTEAQPVGFMPGEAAAFLLVESEASKRADEPVLRLRALAHGHDVPYHEEAEQPMGRGTSEVIERALAAAGSRGMPPLVITDLNGTEARAMDWGYALLHLRSRYGEFNPDMWLTVESFGETGAATGGIGLCMALEAARRGRLDGGAALLLLHAENGGRAALLLDIHPPLH